MTANARLGDRPRIAADESGSAAVEFVLVGVLLTALTLAVLQLGFAIYVRNVVHDAAVEGAYHAALADTDPSDGAARAAEIISRAVGDAYDHEVRAGTGTVAGIDSALVTVTATLPLAGLLGAPRGLEVSAHAPLESLE
ncbi:MAG: TadE/TadG family type IV pilus assembly protein [Microbacterium sp.]